MFKTKHQAILVASLILVALIVTANVFYALEKMDLIGNQLEEVVNEHMHHAIMAEKMVYHARERTMVLHQIVASNDPFEIERLKEVMYSHGTELLKARASVLDSGVFKEEKNILRLQAELTGKGAPVQYKVIELAEEGLLTEARQVLLNELMPIQNKVIALLRQFVELQNTHNREALDISSGTYKKTVRVTVLSILVVVAIGVFLAFYIVRKFALINERLSLRDQELSITNKVLNNNISELNEVTEKLQKSEQQERAIRENMLDAVVTINQYGVIESCNPATEKMFGYSADEMLGENVGILMPQSYRDMHDQFLDKYRSTGQSMNMDMARSQYGVRKDGTVFPLDIGISQMQLENEIKVVGIMRDVTERTEAEKIMRRSKEELEELVKLRTGELEDANQQLMHLARHDALTGLANRTLLEENLKVAVAYARRNQKKVAFMFIDLDGFKKVNDELGHDVGDQLLIKVANRLKSFVRVEDCVSRIGGDEFVIMLFGLDDEKNATITAQRIIDDLSETIDVNGHNVDIGASIGISLFPDNADNCKELIKCADDAMYQVKKSGKNNYIFYGGGKPE